MMQRMILIAGPTASGKSALALAIARHVGGVIINADSMQVYRDLRILTARPSDEDMASVRHELYGYVGGDEDYSVARWLRDAAVVIARCRASGWVPIVVGGTGLYFKALLEGLSPIPDIPSDVRAYWRREAQRLGPGKLHAILSGRDADTAARLQPTDPQRLTRALEVLDATGRGLSTWQAEKGVPVVAESETLRLVVAPEPAVLIERAEARLEEMLAAGALLEVRGLLARGYGEDVPVVHALGVAPLLAVAQGRIDLDAAAVQAKADTRRYIKRQRTWLRRYMIAWKSIDLNEMERIVSGDFTLIHS